MKTIITVLCGALIALPAGAGTIASFKAPSEVRALTLIAMSEWFNKADDATGCASGDCCPDTHANLGCTGSGAPVACCTGAGTGTCNDVACLAFAEIVRLDPNGWADDVESQLQFDGDWLCNSYPESSGSNRLQTACTTTSASPIIDVSRILSEIAGRRHSPVP